MPRSKETTYRIMSAVKSKNTAPERRLGSAMHRLGLRYRKNVKKIPGKPDFVFSKARVAVFVDGDFWHGHNWALRGFTSLDDELKTYSLYWRNKILTNVNRDAAISKQLTEEGWTVIRVWESELKNVDKIASNIYLICKNKR